MTDVLLYLLCCVIGIAVGYIGRWIYAKFKLTSVEQQAVRSEQEAITRAEARAKELLLEARETVQKEQQQSEREARERRMELQKNERRLLQKEMNLEHKQNELDAIKKQLGERDSALKDKEREAQEKEKELVAELEKVASLTREDAKTLIIEQMKSEAEREGQVYLNKIESETKLQSEKIARDIIITSIQRLATEVSGEITTTSVSLPSEEMKGRIIGREGRNIRTLETLTGVDIIIDDTPEAVVISCFDPVRKEIARVALERLVQDGRIHPARIEEVVNKVAKEVGRIIVDEGDKVVFDLGIHNMGPELIRALGRLHFRTSYGQNVLQHSKEVAILAGMIASEVGADTEIAKRGGLLHDIGKGAETESDANHAELGGELVKRLGEDPRVVNAVLSHHNDIEPSCIESVIVQIADAISAARPGARRESLDNYIKRLESLENIAKSFDGVENAYAIQAGRELRILVNSDNVTDEKTREIASGIAQRIEAELRYPGKIKVTIIRELRIVEYAR
ncbi:MAG TPA: ribonuclease Y [Candidatus Ornithospirochaeta avicola]|uniref:Ribonuclease Y n=1 Tax=Candidatus Ornithospirochaeta avicola TaxID=2840896 RepID=A0A9D1PRY4_9SPIO|nr:ribonuclease Y [Candidatus Ornithospirochaeta avicola]